MKHIVHFQIVPANCYAASVLLRKIYRQMERRDWNKSRKEFLELEFKKNGTLTCHYCFKKNLKHRGGKIHEKATVDHVIAISEGGDELMHSNFVVSCESCNRKKSNMNKEEFLKSKYLENKRRISDQLS